MISDWAVHSSRVSDDIVDAIVLILSHRASIAWLFLPERFQRLCRIVLALIHDLDLASHA